MLCHAKKPNTGKPKRKLVGIKPCNKPCGIYPCLCNSKEWMSITTDERFHIKGLFTCDTKEVVFLTTCAKCKKKNIGQTGRKVSNTIKEHLNKICLKKSLAFTTDLKTTIVLRCKSIQLKRYPLTHSITS
jgi:hypothetical protein